MEAVVSPASFVQLPVTLVPVVSLVSGCFAVQMTGPLVGSSPRDPQS